MKPVLCAIIALSGVGCSSTSPGPGSAEITAPSVQTGTGSYYAHKFHGRKTASGETYDENKMTAAHRSLPFGTQVRVTNLKNQKSVDLRINDRGPFVEGRIIDVSYRAAGELDFLKAGLVEVKIEVLNTP